MLCPAYQQRAPETSRCAANQR